MSGCPVGLWYPGFPARQTEVIIDRDEDDEAFIEDMIPDAMGDLCYELSKQWLAKSVQDSLSKLSWRDQTMIKARNAIYRYQADCDGAWGEIHFDFEKKRIHIKRLAEWDTTKSHIYAWKVICFIALSGELPEKKRIVFERE